MSFLERTGELATGALVVSICSGFVVAYQYEVADPFTSAVAVEALIPYGAFWRALHFWASQAFFLILVVHTMARFKDIDRISKGPRGPQYWTILCTTIPMAIFALFTGYVLRFDSTGQAASAIAEHLLKTVPWIGETLNRFLIAVSQEGLSRVYVLHLLLTASLWAIGTWYHTRRVLLSSVSFWSVFVPVAIFSALIHAPIDVPSASLPIIKGPWFFLGVQELLRFLPSLVAGIIFPLVPLVCLGALSWTAQRKQLLLIIAIWTVIYAGLSVSMWMR